MKRIAILTSGGDAPGMNAAIRAATLVGRAGGAEILGIERGYRGLLDDAFVELGANDVAGILREGGTIAPARSSPATPSTGSSSSAATARSPARSTSRLPRRSARAARSR